MTAEMFDFAQVVRAGDVVLWTQGAGEPVACVERLLADQPRIGRFGVFLGASYTGLISPESARYLDLAGMGSVGTNRALCTAGVMDVVPSHLSDLPYLLRSGRLRVDVVVMQLAPSDAEGRFSFGSVNGYVQYALDQARVAVAEINDNAPWTHATEGIDIARFAHVVHSSRPLVDVPGRPPNAIDRAIARHVAAHIENGATLQVGIGTLPQAVLEALSGHSRLGLHSGVAGDGVVDLIERGVIDNSAKTTQRGISVVGGLTGTRRIRDFAHCNPDLLVEPVTITHDPRRLAQLPKLTAVNGAIEVDLTGQVGSEIAGSRYVGTIGGQTDFVRGALLSPGGRSIIALPSRTNGGTPRIVSTLRSGIVTGARADADLIVTEYGAASLRGCSIAERVRRMVAIAHPDDREALETAGASLPGRRAGPASPA